MPKLVIGMRDNQGFTLIEIMIVIVIIGITVGFALIAFGDFGQGRRIVFAAEQFVNVLKLAQQQAQLESITLGMRIDNNGYQLVSFSNHHWQTAGNQGIFKWTNFPEKTRVLIKTAYSAKNGEPAIIFNAAGEMTPFSLTLGTEEQPAMAIITGANNGNLALTLGQTE